MFIFPTQPEIKNQILFSGWHSECVDDFQAQIINWTFQHAFWVDRATPYLPEFDSPALKPPSSFTGGGA